MSLCYIFPPLSSQCTLCAPHTCKAAFWWRGGPRGKYVRREDEWRYAGMLEEGSEMERLFSLIFIYSENVDRGHVLFNCNILFCIHICTHWHPGSAQFVFLPFGHWAAHKSNWGLSAVHRGTLTTVIKAVSSLLFTSPGQISHLCLCHKAACLYCRLVPPQQWLHRARLEQFTWPLRRVLFKGFFSTRRFFVWFSSQMNTQVGSKPPCYLFWADSEWTHPTCRYNPCVSSHHKYAAPRFNSTIWTLWCQRMWCQMWSFKRRHLKNRYQQVHVNSVCNFAFIFNKNKGRSLACAVLV